MNMLETVKIKLNDYHAAKIQAIDDFDFSQTANKVYKEHDGLTQEYLDKGIENLKRYYVVALLDPEREHAVSRFVDPFWHAHILHTTEYNKFCQDIFGQYIQHAPLDYSEKREVDRVLKLYNYTLALYERIFINVDRQWWPALNKTAINERTGPVCLHYEITSDNVRKHAIF